MAQVTEQDYLKAAANAVEAQAAQASGIGIPADPDVAEFMGAFEEGAVIDLDDFELKEGA